MEKKEGEGCQRIVNFDNLINFVIGLPRVLRGSLSRYNPSLPLTCSKQVGVIRLVPRVIPEFSHSLFW